MTICFRRKGYYYEETLIKFHKEMKFGDVGTNELISTSATNRFNHNMKLGKHNFNLKSINLLHLLIPRPD